MAIKRRSFAPTIDFVEKLKDLQIKIRKATGENISLTKLSQEIVKYNLIDELEKRILNQKDDFNLNFQIRFDKRK